MNLIAFIVGVIIYLTVDMWMPESSYVTKLCVALLLSVLYAITYGAIDFYINGVNS